MRRLLRISGALLAALALFALGFFVHTRAGDIDPAVPALDGGAVEADPAPHRIVRHGPGSDPRPDILLFTIDTLRPDHLSAYGHARATSPAMDALARHGTRFTRAYSSSSWTLPAVASLITGVYASEHQVVHSRVFPDRTALQDVLSLDLPSLPAMLHDAGYRTFGITANTHLLGEMGFSRGFDDYECTNFVSTTRAQPAVWRRLDAILSDDRPYFLWVHITDPHMIYRAREPQFSEWWGADGPRYPILDNAIYLRGMPAIAAQQGITVEEALAYATTQYDSEIRAADDMFGALMQQLDDGHLAVILSSDHGEEQMDHGRMGHGYSLYEEVVRIPLIVSVPDQSASVASTPVSIVDVLPTMADLIGIPTPHTAGVSLLAATRGGPLDATRELVMESGRRETLRGLVGPRYVFVERTQPPPTYELLFDLETDPTEQHDAIADHAEIADPMRQRLHDALDAAHALHPEQVGTHQMAIPPAAREQLEALGYGQ